MIELLLRPLIPAVRISKCIALFKTSCDKVSGFTKDDLFDEGRWLMGVLYGERE